MDLPATNPYPYIYAAYGIGVTLVGLYTLWLWIDRKNLDAMKNAIDQHEEKK